MPSVRKRTWTTPAGELKSAWLVDYRDGGGVRRAKQFARKKDADSWIVSTAYDVRQGVHTPDSQSITINQACELWLARCRANDLEPTTLASYEQHVRLHILPLCGALKLSQITTPKAEALRARLQATKSRPMAIRILRGLRAAVSEAQSQGLVAQNVFASVRLQRSKREQSRISIPSKKELRDLLVTATSLEGQPAAALVALVIFSGLRASELRGLTWRNLDLRRGVVHVNQRADASGLIGPPKSATGTRSVPLPQTAVSSLRAWKIACPASTLGLVFPSIRGSVMSHRYMSMNLLDVAQRAAAITASAEGKPQKGRYTLHDFRHAAASLWIDSRASPKQVQIWMGHSSIQVTFDIYGHLFSDTDRDAALAASVEQELLGTGDATWLLQAS